MDELARLDKRSRVARKAACPGLASEGGTVRLAQMAGLALLAMDGLVAAAAAALLEVALAWMMRHLRGREASWDLRHSIEGPLRLYLLSVFSMLQEAFV